MVHVGRVSTPSRHTQFKLNWLVGIMDTSNTDHKKKKMAAKSYKIAAKNSN